MAIDPRIAKVDRAGGRLPSTSPSVDAGGVLAGFRSRLQGSPVPAPAPRPAPAPQPAASASGNVSAKHEFEKPSFLDRLLRLFGREPAVSADELPPKRDANDLRVTSLNSATGAGARYRTNSNRGRLAELIRDSKSDVVALQECDLNQDRSRNKDTALETVAQVQPEFRVFLEGGDFRTGKVGESLPPPCKLEGEDGTIIYRTKGGGTLLFGTSFTGADKSVRGDSGADARYGHALYVKPPAEVTEAYTETLSPNPADGAPTAGELSVAERAARNQSNREATMSANRVRNDTEPRCALVAVVRTPDGRERAVVGTHAGRKGPVQTNQLDHLGRIAAHQASQGRDVVLTGDFNASTEKTARAFERYGLARAGGTGIDQVWVSRGAATYGGADLSTHGTSDHSVGATATLP